MYHRDEEDSTTYRLCQQHFTTPRRMRVHLFQHFITIFCLCSKFSYHKDYILCHQRTMNCYQGHLYDVDETSYPKCFKLIQPLISDSACLEPLSQGFPAPRPITLGPVIKPPGNRKPNTSSHFRESIPRPRTLPHVILQRIETQPRKRSPSTLPPSDRK